MRLIKFEWKFTDWLSSSGVSSVSGVRWSVAQCTRSAE